MSATDRLRRYLEEHVGEIVETERLREVGAVVSYARRLRELREREGMQILSHKDDNSLRPGQYRLVSLERIPVKPPAQPTRRDLLASVRSSSRTEQLRAYAWLTRKFGPLTDDVVSELLGPSH
jgi:hypothetical protein